MKLIFSDLIELVIPDSELLCFSYFKSIIEGSFSESTTKEVNIDISFNKFMKLFNLKKKKKEEKIDGEILEYCDYICENEFIDEYINECINESSLKEIFASSFLTKYYLRINKNKFIFKDSKTLEKGYDLTPLQYFSKYSSLIKNSVEIIHELIDQGADLNIHDKNYLLIANTVRNSSFDFQAPLNVRKFKNLTEINSFIKDISKELLESSKLRDFCFKRVNEIKEPDIFKRIGSANYEVHKVVFYVGYETKKTKKKNNKFITEYSDAYDEGYEDYCSSNIPCIYYKIELLRDAKSVLDFQNKSVGEFAFW